MTTSEIILGIAVAFFGAEKMWKFFITRSDGSFKLKLSRLEKDESEIKLLKAQYESIVAKHNQLESNYFQLKAAFRVMSPLLKKAVEAEPEMKAAFDVLIEFMDEQKNK